MLVVEGVAKTYTDKYCGWEGRKSLENGAKSRKGKRKSKDLSGNSGSNGKSVDLTTLKGDKIDG